MPDLSHQDQLKILRQVPLFSKLDDRQLGQIVQHSDRVTVKAETVLARQGELGREFLVMMSGKARVEQDGETINDLHSGQFFGEISLIDGGPRTTTVVAEVDCDLLVITSRAFSRLLDTIPGLSYDILVALCHYIRNADDKPSRLWLGDVSTEG